MGQSSVAITAGTGTAIDVFQTSGTGNNRQSIVVADPTTDAAAAKVNNAAPGSSDYGLTTRIVGLPAAAALADTTANPTLTEIQTFPSVYNGATWDRMPGDKTNGVYVQIKSSITLAANISQVGGSSVATAATGIIKVGLTDGSGNVINSTSNALNVNLSSGGVVNALSDKQATLASFTITLASLASVGTPPNVAGRQSTLVDNTSNLYIGAKVYLKVKMGTSPTANTLVYVYLIQYDNSAVADDGAGTSDAALTVVNATLLGTILNPSTSTGQLTYGIFDTTKVADSLGPKWGIAIVNTSGVALDATEGNHTKNWIGIKRQLN